jgi:hypothetical protein
MTARRSVGKEMAGLRSSLGLKLLCETSVFAVVVFLCVGLSGAAAPLDAPYQSYTYDFWGKAVPAPQAYLPSRVLDGETLGIGALKDPQDIYVDRDDNVYVVDTANSRIICIEKEWQNVRVISEFQNNGTVDRFKKPEGIFVTDDGQIYVADTGNGRIVQLGPDGELERIIGPPQREAASVFTGNFVYIPKKVAVDPRGQVYVISQSVYDGLLQFNMDGKFSGFIGAPRVAPSAADLFWSKIATKAQRERQSLFLPVDLANIDVGWKGLIYAVEQGTAKSDSIKRLTYDGNDSLVRKAYHPPMGDINQDENGSVFADIAARPRGLYSVLDRKWGRVFTYDESGDLLYVFGGIGEMKGLFRRPAALDDMSNNRIVVLDAQGAVTVFEPTQYGQWIHAAIEFYNRGEYEKSTEMWEKVLDLNSNYDIAYTGIGRAYMRQGKATEALRAFALAQNRIEYSYAYSVYRRAKIEQAFGVFMTVLVVLLILGYILRKYGVMSRLRRKLGFGMAGARGEGSASEVSQGVFEGLRVILDSLRYSLHVVFHPFEGFWDLKHEQKGNGVAATVILLLVAATYVFVRQYTGFIFNTTDLSQLNVVIEVLSIVVPFLLWCIVNWALTTLMEGKGTLKEIYIASAFALTPLILVNAPVTVMSNFLRAEEGTIYYLLVLVGILWAAILLFVSMMMVHDYSGRKAFLTGTLIVAGIAVVMFMGMLAVTVVNHMIAFLVSVYAEVVLRG